MNIKEWMKRYWIVYAGGLGIFTVMNVLQKYPAWYTCIGDVILFFVITTIITLYDDHDFMGRT